MDIFRLTYKLVGQHHPRELLLDVLARRWTARVIVQTVIMHEFPDSELPEMKAGQWTADDVLAQFGISSLECTYVNWLGEGWHGQVTAAGIVI